MTVLLPSNREASPYVVSSFRITKTFLANAMQRNSNDDYSNVSRKAEEVICVKKTWQPNQSRPMDIGKFLKTRDLNIQSDSLDTSQRKMKKEILTYNGFRNRRTKRRSTSYP